jgi:alpha-L-rhamnosidase
VRQRHRSTSTTWPEDGLITSDAVTVNALAIVFGLLDDDQQHRVGARLAHLVAEGGYHIATGFAGTPYVTDALTVWERVDSMLPDGTIFNNYALGAVADWMHRTVGGIAPEEPGYSRVRVAPRPGGGLTWATTSLATPHGPVEVRWRREDDRLTVETSLPEGVTGVLDLPGHDDVDIAAGTHEHVAVQPRPAPGEVPR